jgi:hypothetical protein
MELTWLLVVCISHHVKLQMMFDQLTTTERAKEAGKSAAGFALKMSKC